MKTIIISLLLITTLFSLCTAQNLLNNPESVVYNPYDQSYIVSSYGDGNIVRIDAAGQQSYFSTDLAGHAIVGMYVLDDVLYVAANSGTYAGVVGFDLQTAQMQIHFPIVYSGLLNDITSDADGFLYVTDYWDSKLFKMNPQNGQWWLYDENGMFNSNGITSDTANQRLISVGCATSCLSLIEIDLSDSTVSILQYTGLTGMDGIVFDDEGYLYISEWTTNSVQRYNPGLLPPPETFSSGHDAPADIYYNPWLNELAVPDFYADSVEFIPIVPSGIEAGGGDAPTTEFTLLGCYPNPFNASTTISFDLPVSCWVKLDVFDVYGCLVLGGHTGSPLRTGPHILAFDASSLASGVYFYRITAEGIEREGRYSDIGKMVLLK